MRGFGEGNKEGNRGIASWLSVRSTMITVVLHEGRWTLRCSASGKAKKRLRRMVRDKGMDSVQGVFKKV